MRHLYKLMMKSNKIALKKVKGNPGNPSQLIKGEVYFRKIQDSKIINKIA